MPVELPVTGAAWAVTHKLLTESLGPEATVDLQGQELIITLDSRLLAPDRLPEWQHRLDQLAARESAKRSGGWATGCMHSAPTAPTTPRDRRSAWCTG